MADLEATWVVDLHGTCPKCGENIDSAVLSLNSNGEGKKNLPPQVKTKGLNMTTITTAITYAVTITARIARSDATKLDSIHLQQRDHAIRLGSALVDAQRDAEKKIAIAGKVHFVLAA